MDFSRKIKREVRKPTTGSLVDVYPHDVQLYLYPPTYDIHLQEFEDLAVERLKLLRIIEQASAKNHRTYSPEWKESIITDLKKDGLKSYVRLIQGTGTGSTEADLLARKKDHISHFILRLAYCRSKELQMWFLSREMELFKMRFSALGVEGIKQFLKLNNLSYSPISEAEKSAVKDGLYESTLGQSVAQIETQDFYKVPFTEVFDLVRTRRVFLSAGYAYVPTNEFVSVVSSRHHIIINTGLEATNRILPEIEDDTRLVQLLKGLHTSYTGKDYTLTKTSCVPIESIDHLSKKSFPLCMRHCHEIFRAKHHLKYFGRQQYGLFLKAIGVTFEDSMRFWREEFTKLIDIEKFEKSYTYNIKHNYGKVGSMLNYSPYSCMKIITSPVGPLDTHGCPYKIFDTATLKQKMISYGISVHHANEVASFAAKGHYQIACAKYFEISHNVKYDGGISHPNQYFEESQIVIGNRQRSSKSQQISGGKSSETYATQMLNQDNWDEELWNAGSETEKMLNESQNKETVTETIIENKEKSGSKDGWDDDFDMSLVEEY